MAKERRGPLARLRGRAVARRGGAAGLRTAGAAAAGRLLAAVVPCVDLGAVGVDMNLFLLAAMAAGSYAAFFPRQRQSSRSNPPGFPILLQRIALHTEPMAQ